MNKRDILWRDTSLTFVRVPGGLNLVPTTHGIERAQEYLTERANRSPSSSRSPDNELTDFFECAMGNGWDYVRPEDIGALTDATIISKDGFIGDDGKWYPHPSARRARVYAHMNYAVEDPIETWARGETVFFQGAEVTLTKTGRDEVRKAYVTRTE
jgi:hypothetical protein